ncbi:hypothetical protein [Undibacterium sp. Xuan67W]|uniref:hypothetical protein n=1 Tax=Undibacterium sp. Xuan67W TaxID=3413057 RepID=UPI003BEFEEB4
MRNIKTEVASYREAVRHLWNSAFSSLDEPLRFGVCLELFEEIDDLIFRALVCEPLGIEFEKKATNEPFTDFKVVPISLLTEVPVMINRSVPACGYWDDPIKTIRLSDVDFALIGFFDWDGYNVKDCAYYRVRIIDCKSQPNLAGRDALIETLNANVFLIEQD